MLKAQPGCHQQAQHHPARAQGGPLDPPVSSLSFDHHDANSTIPRPINRSNVDPPI
jgi:hypothetical protein